MGCISNDFVRRWRLVTFRLKLSHLHLSICLHHFSAKCHKYQIHPWRCLGSVRWNGVRVFMVFLPLEAVLQDWIFRPKYTLHSMKILLFLGSSSQSLRTIEQFQFLSCVHREQIWCRSVSTMQCRMLAGFVISPHEQRFLPSGFIFVHQLDDAGKCFSCFINLVFRLSTHTRMF